VTVVVYEGHVKATSGGQTVNVTPGATVELLPGRSPQPPGEVHPDKPAEPIAVGATARDVSALEAELRSARDEIAQLKADLAARTVHDSPPPAPRPAPRDRTVLAPAPTPASRDRTVPAPEVHNDHPPGFCDTALIDDIVMQAANQFSAGFSKSALSLMQKALQCQQNVRMYRLAAAYACAAHDLATAREMFEKLPAQFQPAIVQRCQLEGLDLSRP
jgi:hypothetical protein